MKGVVSYFAKMEAIMQYLRDFNIVTVTLRLVLAFLFGGIIGMDRERKGRPAGMRTHIPVSYTHLDVYKRQAYFSEKNACFSNSVCKFWISSFGGLPNIFL